MTRSGPTHHSDTTTPGLTTDKQSSSDENTTDNDDIFLNLNLTIEQLPRDNIGK